MGGASSVVALLDKGIGLGIGEQAELVPVQRQIIELELERQNKQAKSSGGGNTGGRRQNPRASMGGGAGGGKMDETVKYINESEN